MKRKEENLKLTPVKFLLQSLKINQNKYQNHIPFNKGKYKEKKFKSLKLL